MTTRTIIFSVLLSLLAGATQASPQDAQIPLPEVRVVDGLGVNLQTHQVTASQETVSIGGERGLSHSISLQTNHFVTTGGWHGYMDKYAGKARYVVFGENISGFSGTDCGSIGQIALMRLSGPEGSEDFKVKVNGVVDCNIDGINNPVTSNYSYQALGDSRNLLEIIPASDTQEYSLYPQGLRWTRADGTELYYQRYGSPIHATAEGRLRRIVYPNGFTIDIETGNVTSNTGFHLKYEHEPVTVNCATDPTNAACLSASKRSLYNSLAAALPGGQDLDVSYLDPGQFAVWNPRRVRAVNRAFEYCAPTVQNCGSSWPAATFTWPGGMPRAIYLGNSVFSVQDALGVVTEYHYQAQDIMRMEDGSYAGEVISGQHWPHYPGQVWSPRLVGIKTAGSSVFQREYQYRTRFYLDGYGGTNFWRPAGREGEVKNARGPQNAAGGVNYGRAPMQSGAEALMAHWSQGTYRMEPVHLYPGRISLMNIPGQGQYFYYNNYSNLIHEFTPLDSAEPKKNYEYDGRGNLKKIILRQGQSDQSVIEAGYLASCTSAQRKDCNKPLWVSRVRAGNPPTEPDPSERTDYVYDAATGQVLRVTGPADANGIRPVTRYEYADFYASYYRSNGSTLEQDSRPVSLLAREITCRSTAMAGDVCAGGALDTVVTDYDYGSQQPGVANNLWLRSVSITAEVNGALQTRTTCYEYDRYGNRIGETQPMGTAGGCSTSVPQQAAPYKYAKRYNSAGRLLGEISPDPDGDGFNYPAIRHTYNSLGQLIKTEHGILTSWQSEATPPAGWSGFNVSKQVLYTYDGYGRRLSERVAEVSGNAEILTQQSYDAYNRVQCKAVRLNPAAAPANACALGPEGGHGPDRITSFDYNSFDKVLKEHRAVGTDQEQVYLEYTYNSKNLIETVTDANGNRAKFEYDNYGRKIKWCFPSNIRGSGDINCNDYESYTYDVNGNRTSLRKRDAKIILYQYDNLNRMVYKNIPDTTANDVYYRYELTGAQLYARFGSHGGQGVTTNYTGFGEPEQDSVNLGASPEPLIACSMPTATAPGSPIRTITTSAINTTASTACKPSGKTAARH